MAAEQAIVPAKKVARRLGSTEEEHDHVVPRSLTIDATINPVRIAIRDLFSHALEEAGHYERREASAGQHDHRQEWEGGI